MDIDLWNLILLYNRYLNKFLLMDNVNYYGVPTPPKFNSEMRVGIE